MSVLLKLLFESFGLLVANLDRTNIGISFLELDGTIAYVFACGKISMSSSHES